MGNKAESYLINCLGNEDTDVSMTAAWLLYAYGCPNATKAMFNALDNTSAPVTCVDMLYQMHHHSGRLEKPFKSVSIEPPGDEHILELKQVFESFGLTVHEGG